MSYRARRGSDFRVLRREGIASADDARGETLSLTGDQNDGVVNAGTEDEFNDADATFAADGVLAGDLLKISGAYHTILAVTETMLTVDGTMATGTGISYTVVRPDDGLVQTDHVLDMTDTTRALILAKFNGDATSIDVHLEAEVDRSSTYRARIGSAVTLAGSRDTGAAAIVEHGGCVVRPRVTSVTPGVTGSVDIAVIPAAS